jgi:hypothetical protein
MDHTREYVDRTGCHQLVSSPIRPTSVVTPGGRQIGYTDHIGGYVDHTGCLQLVVFPQKVPTLPSRARASAFAVSSARTTPSWSAAAA